MSSRIIYISIILAFFWACRGTSDIPEGQHLYTGAEIKFNSDEKVMDKGEVKGVLDNLLAPEPNDAILGMRPKLWIHNIFDTVKKDKGFKHWVKYELGNPPVLLNEVEEERIATSLQTALENNGFWTASVDYEVKKDKKTAAVDYVANVDQAYVFNEIYLPQDTSELSKAIKAVFTDKNIEKGSRFNLQDLQEKRTEIQQQLKNRGFYYFSANHLLYEIDTTIGERKVNVYMRIKPETPPRAKRIQRINKVIVNSDYQISDSVQIDHDTLRVQELFYVRNKEEFRPEIIANQVRLKEGSIYTRTSEEITISRLIDLGVFKYVNIHFEDAGPGKINSFIRLSPMKKKSLQVELRGVTKSNSFVGPVLETSFINRNIFDGAETYQLSLSAGYEWQIGPSQNIPGGQNQNLNSYELGINNTLKVPRLVTPFNIHYYSTRYVPQTNFDLGYRLLKRINFFQLNSFDLGYGFQWRETMTKTHSFYPVDVSYIRLSNTSDSFEELLQDNLFLRRSYENQFILGTTYSFTYNSQARPENTNNTHNFYFNGNLDLSGNLMHLIQQTSRSEENTADDPYTIFGSAYSQFVRTDLDFRYYLRLDRKNRLAYRIILGVGIPYGNSEVLPYTKQFAIGGSSSIRAFRARALGPGGFNLSDELEQQQDEDGFVFIDQTADLKIETNLEYRFDLIGNFKGAVFVDAGNIWTIEDDPDRPGAQFQASEFLSQMAVGAGFGVRLDIEFFVLRLDLATPVRIPSRNPGDRWLLRLRDTTTEGEKYTNVVLNIAIGYPF